MKRYISFLIVLSLLLAVSCREEFTLDIPFEFTASKGDYVDKIVLEWNIPPKTEQIEIFRFDSSINDYKSIWFSNGSSFTDIISFIPNVYYYYKIRSHNSSKELSDFTNYDYGYVSDFNSPTITEIGYGSSETSINIVWNIVNGSETYTIFKSENNVEYNELGTSESNQFIDSENLIPGITYYYKIKAFNEKLGFSEFSQPDSGYILESYSYTNSFGSFNYGYGIEFDENNKIYISDVHGGTIKVYNPDYSFKEDLIATGKTLRGLSWSNDGNLLAVNSEEGRLLEIDNSGNIISDFNVSNSYMLRETVTDNVGNIYITDVHNNDIVKLNSSGELIMTWKMKQVNQGSFFYTSGLEFMDNKIIVSGVNSSDYVEIYDTDGNFLNQWSFPYSAGYMSQDEFGNLYFACFNNKVIKTDKNGKILAFIGNDKLQRCESVNVNSSGLVFASDEYQSSQIHVFTKN